MVLCHIKPKRLNPGYVGSQKQHYQASQAALNIFQHPCSGLASQSFCFISFIFGEPTQFSPELRGDFLVRTGQWLGSCTTICDIDMPSKKIRVRRHLCGHGKWVATIIEPKYFFLLSWQLLANNRLVYFTVCHYPLKWVIFRLELPKPGSDRDLRHPPGLSSNKRPL